MGQIWCSLQICLRNFSMSVFVCEEGSGRRQSQGSIVSLGRECWQRWRIDVPLRRLREGRLWKAAVSWWYAYSLNTDGCRVVSGMCQGLDRFWHLRNDVYGSCFFFTVYYAQLILQEARPRDIYSVDSTFQNWALVDTSIKLSKQSLIFVCLTSQGSWITEISRLNSRRSMKNDKKLQTTHRV